MGLAGATQGTSPIQTLLEVAIVKDLRNTHVIIKNTQNLEVAIIIQRW